ncbi:hypothetical protein [Pseudomonas sp. SLFW]|uniref:hypothetical protein n=1 Tax=Pseudomonas sp. SLFW TaxID=2683259 RepID=UPI001411D02F|nr:hypothetical protein [Pseudomonas sp. SLFW]NBB09552.1 hypothetical protein [Pseudomonas sp. SLFW]
MAVSNIERFDNLASRLFAELYESFPMGKDIDTANYLDPATQWSERYQQEVLIDDGEFFLATVLWLQRAGYLSVDKYHHSRVSDVVLTAKGLEVLRAVPGSLQGDASIGEQLADAAKSGGKEAMRGLLSEALGIGARLLGPYVGLTP